MDRHQIRALRSKNRLTQAEFGKMLGLSTSTVANIEAGRRGISDNVYSRLADLPLDLGVEFHSFFMRYKEISKTNPSKA